MVFHVNHLFTHEISRHIFSEKAFFISEKSIRNVVVFLFFILLFYNFIFILFLFIYLFIFFFYLFIFFLFIYLFIYFFAFFFRMSSVKTGLGALRGKVKKKCQPTIGLFAFHRIFYLITSTHLLLILNLFLNS